ncbi:exodeoxyribonuclease V subunit alpha [Halomonas sp. PAMB 3264]|uniref:exodeoxyribonuclease V subunit alpha n=1 Tax=Halomonas sp. PAMB 3264 TaxID=3075222 RepID=UPI00289AF3BF|nr:exodeoxyribonuclease V subunit alpha [Halomonas sp. PAMB 3264]WNL43332.1 exodeoxyribonuclease V subunit alpha [Halomonas sp. PAMB 3264]
MSRKDTQTFDLFDAPDEPATQEPSAPAAPHAALFDPQALLDLLERWVARGWLRDLDRALARFLLTEAPDAPALLLLAAALASHQLGRGHVCLELAATLDAPDFALSLPPEGDDLIEPPLLPSALLETLTLDQWQAALDHPLLVSAGPGNTPLVASATRLYLRRFWQYEQTLHAEIATRLTANEDVFEQANTGRSPVHWAMDDASHPDHATTTNLLSRALNTLFTNTQTLDWQKTACALAARRRFAVITGGPGTGKTTTVVRLLALLQTLRLSHAPAEPLRIRLAAPTGKAAARLNESIAGQVSGLPTAALEALLGEHFDGALDGAIPTEVTTLHRLLGARPDTRHFRHGPHNPLALDVLVIDEASMVDIEMMTAVLSALPANAQLVLLGDKDQLASVEAGAVLGDLCRRAEAAHYTRATAAWLEAATGQPIPEAFIDEQGQPLDQTITMLRVSHRFNEQSGIGQLAQAINQPGDAMSERDKQQAVNQLLRQGYPDVQHRVLGGASGQGDAALDALVIDGSPKGFAQNGEGRIDHKDNPVAPPTGYRHYLSVLKAQRPEGASFEADPGAFDAWAGQVLTAYGRFQLLCALRKGPWGVEGLNPRIAHTLRRDGWLSANDVTLEKGWYEGRPVLVTQNDYALKLMNGDIGITLAVPDPRAPGQSLLRVAFPTSDPAHPIRWVLPSRLHSVETVFAMTVHKSQGSEFVHTALLLPATINPILTRELVYTGITRAREWLTVVEAKRGILNEAVVREVMRA